MNNLKNIKVGALLILLLSFTLSACGQPQQKASKEVSIHWSEIDQGVGLEVGDILEIVLPASPSTGAVWEIGFYNQSVLKPYEDPEYYKLVTDPDAGEFQNVHFEAIDVGETEVWLLYQQPSENEVVYPQAFQVNVVVKKVK